MGHHATGRGSEGCAVPELKSPIGTSAFRACRIFYLRLRQLPDLEDVGTVCSPDYLTPQPPFSTGLECRPPSCLHPTSKGLSDFAHLSAPLSSTHHRLASPYRGRMTMLSWVFGRGHLKAGAHTRQLQPWSEQIHRGCGEPILPPVFLFQRYTLAIFARKVRRVGEVV
jgi:hypothetical protein